MNHQPEHTRITMNHAFEIIPLTVEARGEIITNNLPEFRELVRAALGNINRDLRSDEDFGQAEKDVKALKNAEDAVREAALKAFDDQLKELVDGLNETAEEIRVPRLELEKLIAKRKEEVKSELVEEFLGTFDIDPKDARKHFLGGLQNAIKGKRTLESMRTALRVYATTQQAIITKNRGAIDTFEKGHGVEMTMDRRELELKSAEFVEGELRRRFEAKKAAEERKRLEAEAANAKAEAQAAIREAEAAKQPAKPAPLPAPPKIGSIPVGVQKPEDPPAGNVVEFPQSEDAEWAAFKTAVFTSFGPLKAARELLKHHGNIARAAKFAHGVNAAWQAANEKEVAR